MIDLLNDATYVSTVDNHHNNVSEISVRESEEVKIEHVSIMIISSVNELYIAYLDVFFDYNCCLCSQTFLARQNRLMNE
jgi:hypothetical protein